MPPIVCLSAIQGVPRSEGIGAMRRKPRFLERFGALSKEAASSEISKGVAPKRAVVSVQILLMASAMRDPRSWQRPTLSVPL